MVFEIKKIEDERLDNGTFQTKAISGELEDETDVFKLKFERQEDDSWAVLPDCDKSCEAKERGTMGRLICPNNFIGTYTGQNAYVSVIGEDDSSNRHPEAADTRNAKNIIKTWVKPNEVTNIETTLTYVSIAKADIVNPAGVKVAKLTAKDCINHPYPDILVTDLRNGKSEEYHTHLDTMTADHPVVDLLAGVKIAKMSDETGKEGYCKKLAEDQIGYFVTRANELKAQR